MARVSVGRSTAQGISDRLWEFYFEPGAARASPRVSNRRSLARRLGISVATVYDWFPSDGPKPGGYKPPRVPDPRHIIRMAEKDRLSPAWLLVNEGPQLLGSTVPEAKLASLLLKNLIAELRSLGVPPAVIAELPEARTMLRSFVRRWAQFLEDVDDAQVARHRFKQELRGRTRKWHRRHDKQISKAIPEAVQQAHLQRDGKQVAKLTLHAWARRLLKARKNLVAELRSLGVSSAVIAELTDAQLREVLSQRREASRAVRGRERP